MAPESVISAGVSEFPYRFKFDIFGPHVAGRAAGNVIVSQEGKLAYVPIPKNACTSLKMFFYELRKGVPFPGHFQQIHEHFSYTAIDFKKFAEDREHFKFLVVRDPLERFVSAFNNRVRGYQELSEKWVTRHAPRELKGFQKRGLAFDPDINEFARRLEDYIAVSMKISHHFIPQRRFFHNNLAAFDKVYTVRQMPVLATDLAERLGRPVVFPNVQESGGVENAAKVTDLGTAELAAVMKYYAKDYQTLAPLL